MTFGKHAGRLACQTVILVWLLLGVASSSQGFAVRVKLDTPPQLRGSGRRPQQSTEHRPGNGAAHLQLQHPAAGKKLLEEDPQEAVQAFGSAAATGSRQAHVAVSARAVAEVTEVADESEEFDHSDNAAELATDVPDASSAIRSPAVDGQCLPRCTSAALNGTWFNSTWVPSSPGPDGEPGPPPCYYHFYSAQAIVHMFHGRWVFFAGDSNTRGMFLALLQILDPDHSQPFNDKLWFNVSLPHELQLYHVDYYLLQGKVVLKTAGALLRADEIPSWMSYDTRISFSMFRETTHMLEAMGGVLGPYGFGPDIMYFNTGTWDAGSNDGCGFCGDWDKYKRNVRALMQRIKANCHLPSKLCFWGTITGLLEKDIRYQNSSIMGTLTPQLLEEVNAEGGLRKPVIHLLDRFVTSSQRKDQMRGQHLSHLVNMWDLQRMLNVLVALDREAICGKGSSCHCRHHAGDPHNCAALRAQFEPSGCVETAADAMVLFHGHCVIRPKHDEASMWRNPCSFTAADSRLPSHGRTL